MIDKSKLDQVVAQYEKVIEGLEVQITAQEANPFDKLSKEKLERELEQLRTENAKLAKQKIMNFGQREEAEQLKARADNFEW